MKRIKVLISSFLIFFTFVFIGESYHLYLSNYESNFYHTTIYNPLGIDEKQMKEEILSTANKHNIKFFISDSKVKSTIFQDITIYCTSGVEEHINSKFDIYEKEYNSLLTGKVNIKFKDFESIDNLENHNQYYLIGKPEDMNEFKRTLINKYAGNFPREGYSSNHYKIILGVWIIIGIVMLLLSAYDVMFQKKENFIRVSLGESINNIVLKNIFIDTICYISVFLISILILRNKTNVLFGINISMTMFGVILLINALMYSSLYFYNIKEVLSNSKSSKKLLMANYVLKIITIVIATIILSGNIAIIVEGFSFYKQKSFFEEHKDYDYVKLEYKLRPDKDNNIIGFSLESKVVQQMFYDKFYEKFNSIDLVNLGYDDLDNVIFSTSNNLSYLKTKIEYLNNKDLDKELYYFIPIELKDVINIDEDLKFVVESQMKGYKYSKPEIIYYEDDTEIISIDEMYKNGSKLVKNPIIIYQNKVEPLRNYDDIDISAARGQNLRNVMFKISEDEYNDFIKEYKLENELVVRTNVLEKYLYQLNIIKRGVYISFILSILILFLEVILIKSILMLEYEANAIELSIKKILGYNNFDKNKGIFILTIASTAISIILSIVVSSIMNISKVYYISIGGVLIFTLEILLILYYIKKLEKTNLQKILKGGRI